MRCVCICIHIYLAPESINLAMFLLPYYYTEAHSIRLMLFKSTMVHLYFILLCHLDFCLIGSFLGSSNSVHGVVLLKKLTVEHKRNPCVLWNQLCSLLCSLEPLAKSSPPPALHPPHFNRSISVL
jgi:hypothetical protein